MNWRNLIIKMYCTRSYFRLILLIFCGENYNFPKQDDIETNAVCLFVLFNFPELIRRKPRAISILLWKKHRLWNSLQIWKEKHLLGTLSSLIENWQRSNYKHQRIMFNSILYISINLIAVFNNIPSYTAYKTLSIPYWRQVSG